MSARPGEQRVVDEAPMPLISLILPTLNEEHFDEALDRLAEQLLLLDKKYDFELLVVDDSCLEKQCQLLRWIAERESWAPRIQLRFVNGARRGKGNAVKLGAQNSRGDIVFVMDADLPVPLSHVGEFLERFDDPSCDIVIGERPFDRNLRKPLRWMLSRALFMMQFVIVFQRAEFRDTQCGFKAFRGSLIRSFAARQQIDGGMYDVEYLCLAVREQRNVLRIPVIPNPETRPSKIKVWKCVVTDPAALVGIKARALTGRYNPERQSS